MEEEPFDAPVYHRGSIHLLENPGSFFRKLRGANSSKGRPSASGVEGTLQPLEPCLAGDSRTSIGVDGLP